MATPLGRTGAKGHRFYDWALIDIDPSVEYTGHRWLLIRRNRRTKELAFCRCYAPTPVALPVLVRVAGTRWRVEESFQTSKGLAGLDQHQVRRWVSWHRWTILAMLGHALLTVIAATERARAATPASWISLTCNEVQHLLATLLATPIKGITHRLHFSVWRRRHQHRARQAHYQRQSTREP